MHYLALATDYDGTIADDGVVEQPTLAALERLRDGARRLILVTGRDLADLRRVKAAFIGIIDQFEVMMIVMLIVSPLVLFLRKPRPANQQGA